MAKKKNSVHLENYIHKELKIKAAKGSKGKDGKNLTIEKIVNDILAKSLRKKKR